MTYEKNQFSFYQNIELQPASGITETSYIQLIGTNIAGTSNVKSVVAITASTVTLLESNKDRKEAIITNESPQPLYLKYGSTASVTSYTFKLLENEVKEINTYFGIIDGIWSGETIGNARITETI